MKKIVVMAFALFSLGFIAKAEIAGNGTESAIVAAYQSDKVKISKEELPQAVKDTLAMSYKEWKVVDVYKVSGTNEYYSIELKKENGTETKTLNLDKNGKEAKIEA